MLLVFTSLLEASEIEVGREWLFTEKGNGVGSFSTRIQFFVSLVSFQF